MVQGMFKEAQTSMASTLRWPTERSGHNIPDFNSRATVEPLPRHKEGCRSQPLQAAGVASASVRGPSGPSHQSELQGSQPRGPEVPDFDCGAWSQNHNQKCVGDASFAPVSDNLYARGA